MRLGLNPGAVRVGFMVDKVAMGKVFFEYFSFPAALVSPLKFHSLIIHGWYAGPACSVSTKPTTRIKISPCILDWMKMSGLLTPRDKALGGL
jgi:hypothetical protein